MNYFSGAIGSLLVLKITHGFFACSFCFFQGQFVNRMWVTMSPFNLTVPNKVRCCGQNLFHCVIFSFIVPTCVHLGILGLYHLSVVSSRLDIILVVIFPEMCCYFAYDTLTLSSK